jgi:hypothetical protein
MIPCFFCSVLTCWSTGVSISKLRMPSSELRLGENSSSRLDHRAITRIKNSRRKPSNWYSFNAAHAAFDKLLHARGLILASLCVNKGWIVAEWDLESLADKRTFAAQAFAGGKAGAVQAAKAKVEALKKNSC